MPTQWREPQQFTSGDTLSFERNLPDYPASDGWSLLYELRGGAQPIEFSSVADGGNHSVTVAASDTALWLPADYVLVGFAVKGAERQQIYYGQLQVLENFPATPGDAPQKTFAQQMVENLEAVMLGKAGNDLLESNIGETRFKYLSPEQLRMEHGYWVSVRKNEIAIQKAKEGRPTGNKIRPRMAVKGVGLTGGVWPFRL
jgi:hypothetical protein